MTATPKDYRHIAAWGRMMGSFPYYVTAQQEKAATDKAPLDAIYKGDAGWQTFANVTSPQTVDVIERILAAN